MSETEPRRVPLTPVPPRADPSGLGGSYEYRVLSLPRGISRSEARRLLAEQAEYGHWELARVRMSVGGARRVWLRRKIIRVGRTA
jgi:Family of unknown function (DUF5703)